MSNKLPPARTGITACRQTHQFQPQPPFAILPRDLDSRVWPFSGFSSRQQGFKTSRGRHIFPQ